ncbi:hypothetical protein [Methanosarcina sp. UBA411]|jgi:hypothetical protein|uniref:hypothetical protein n=1 Tax=Methanosarcina sp. UBA411 TaxID=1915589 RepID=UPI0025D6B4D7|nr:hypothetical protein [Methanosarcina sp. UBA411]
MLFIEIAPIIILLTLIISALIAVKIKISSFSTIDVIFAILGTILGLIITFLNLIYSNNYLITIGPLVTIASLLHLKYRSKLLANSIDLNMYLNNRALKIIQTIYWVCILIALISYYQAKPYHRPAIFFFSISLAVSSLGLEILSRTYEKDIQLYALISKILILSLILRFSAYFISPYPVGSDPWRHADLIKGISIYGTIYLPQISEYYSNYPLMHLYASISGLIGNLTTKDAMFIIGMVLTISTIFIYIIVKKITNSIPLALFSMLLINFSDFHIQWSIQIIAMSFGIAIYAMTIYLLIEQNEKITPIYKILTILAICIITWTHTVSSFICIVSLISLYIGSFIYERLYANKCNYAKLRVNNTLFTFFLLILTCHWTDPKYPFLKGITTVLINSLSMDADFLGRGPVSNVGDSWFSILDILGFLILIFFGVIGSLHSLSKEHQTKTKVSLIFMLVVLFSIFFIFPVMGIRNILPYRWPAFIYTTFVLFSGIGIFKISTIFKYRCHKVIFISMLLILFSFFMITNSVTDMDSPVYGKNLNQKMIWTESEMEMFANINSSSDDIIVSDLQTTENIFITYLKRDNVATYLLTPRGVLDWEYMGNKVLTWRKTSLDRPVQVKPYESPDMLLGSDFKHNLDNNYHAIYNSGEAKEYLGVNNR